MWTCSGQQLGAPRYVVGASLASGQADGWMDMFDMLSTRIAEHATPATLTSGLWCDNNDNNVEQGNMRHKLRKEAGTLGDGGRRHKHKVIATICSLREWTTDKGATTAEQPAELPSIWTGKGRDRGRGR